MAYKLLQRSCKIKYQIIPIFCLERAVRWEEIMSEWGAFFQVGGCEERRGERDGDGLVDSGSCRVTHLPACQTRRRRDVSFSLDCHVALPPNTPADSTAHRRAFSPRLCVSGSNANACSIAGFVFGELAASRRVN